MMTLAGGGGARGGKGQQNPKQQQQHGSGEGTQGQHYQRGGGHGYGGRGGKRGGQQNASAQQQQRTMERERQALQQRAPAPPHQQRQQQHPTPAPALPPESAPGFNGFNPADLSLAQALGQVLSSFSDTLATEHDIDARMRGHPQGANWRSCLEVMVEQSVRHGALHPRGPQHVAASTVLDTQLRVSPAQLWLAPTLTRPRFAQRAPEMNFLTILALLLVAAPKASAFASMQYVRAENETYNHQVRCDFETITVLLTNADVAASYNSEAVERFAPKAFDRQAGVVQWLWRRG